MICLKRTFIKVCLLVPLASCSSFNKKLNDERTPAGQEYYYKSDCKRIRLPSPLEDYYCEPTTEEISVGRDRLIQAFESLNYKLQRMNNVEFQERAKSIGITNISLNVVVEIMQRNKILYYPTTMVLDNRTWELVVLSSELSRQRGEPTIVAYAAFFVRFGRKIQLGPQDFNEINKYILGSIGSELGINENLIPQFIKLVNEF